MKIDKESNLLQSIFNDMQMLKKSLLTKDERRVDIKEFAERLNLSEPTVWDRIREGVLEHPQKDGRRNFWLNSYVNFAVQHCKKSDKVAA